MENYRVLQQSYQNIIKGMIIIMEQIKIDRINELARIAKHRELTQSEEAERKALREEYIAAFRASLRGTLENTTVVRPDGSSEKLSEAYKHKK